MSSEYTLLYDAGFEMAEMIFEGGVILAGHCAPTSTFKATIAFSLNLGKTWSVFELAELEPRSSDRFQPDNSAG